MSFRYLLYYWIGRVLIKVFERRKRSFGNIKLNSYTYYSKILGGLLDGNNTYKCTNMVTILSWFCASDHPPVINCREINILNCSCAYGIKLPFFQDFSVLWTPWLFVQSSGFPYPVSLAKCAFDWSAWPTILVFLNAYKSTFSFIFSPHCVKMWCVASLQLKQGVHKAHTFGQIM